MTFASSGPVASITSTCSSCGKTSKRDSPSAMPGPRDRCSAEDRRAIGVQVSAVGEAAPDPRGHQGARRRPRRCPSARRPSHSAAGSRQRSASPGRPAGPRHGPQAGQRQGAIEPRDVDAVPVDPGSELHAASAASVWLESAAAASRRRRSRCRQDAVPAEISLQQRSDRSERDGAFEIVDDRATLVRVDLRGVGGPRREARPRSPWRTRARRRPGRSRRSGDRVVEPVTGGARVGLARREPVAEQAARNRRAAHPCPRAAPAGERAPSRCRDRRPPRR